MLNQVCLHAFISGLVHGVGFRIYTQEKAFALGLKGWVRNLEDGRVEVLAVGDPLAIQSLDAWLQQGPKRAKVLEVQTQQFPHFSEEIFTII